VSGCKDRKIELSSLTNFYFLHEADLIFINSVLLLFVNADFLYLRCKKNRFLTVMMKRYLMPLVILCAMVSSCAMFQSIVKSSFPYTATIVIPASSHTGNEYSAISVANSFDQNFSKSGNNGDRITLVRIISAKLMSTDPSDYNIGNLYAVKIYLSKEDGKDEILVASRDDIGATVGNNVVLDIDNSHMLDELVRESNIRVRMAYKVRHGFKSDASLHVVLGLACYPAPK
jgi:hypothetical protein